MAGKYEGVLDKLPRYEDPNKTYADKINQRKAELLQTREDAESNKSEDVALGGFFVHPETPDEKLIADAEMFVREGLKQLMTAARMLNLGINGRRNPNVVARFYREFRIMKGAMAEQEGDVNLSIAAIESMLADIYEVEDISSVRLRDGGSVGVQWEPYSSVVDRDAHREWAIKNGLERSLALPWQTTNAISKEMLLQGKEPPAGVKVTAKPKVVLRKG